MTDLFNEIGLGMVTLIAIPTGIILLIKLSIKFLDDF